MSLIIRWTAKAEFTFNQIIQYLENKWSERQVPRFVKTVNNIIKKIAEFPHMFESSSSNTNIRKGYITKQCSLFYEFEMM